MSRVKHGMIDGMRMVEIDRNFYRNVLMVMHVTDSDYVVFPDEF